jgi:hypothetical protein
LPIPSNTTVNTITPAAEFKSPAVSFTVSFTEVREVNAAGKSVKSFPIVLSNTSAVLTVINGTTTWNYSIPLVNGAYIMAAFTTATQAQVINFSNKTFTLAPNVLKSSITVFQYPFAANTNKLYIVFSLGSNTTSSYKVSNSDGQLQLTDSDGNAQYAKFNMGGTQLFAKFLSYGVVDAQSIVVQTSIDTSKNQFLMILPRFVSHGMVDPDFAVTGADEPSSEGKSKRNRHHHDIVVGTTVGILLGGPVVGVVVWWLITQARKKHMRDTRRDVKLNDFGHIDNPMMTDV